MLQQKVWIQTSAPLYPNLYVFLVGPPGVGKSRTISSIGNYLRDLEGFHIAPTSMTGASLIDALDNAKVNYAFGPKEGQSLHFNSMLVMPDELSALMHEYDRALVAALTTFYDVLPYSQTRRTGSVSIKIPLPQLSILAGTTTAHLLKTLPQEAWDQGLMSRTILIFSGDRPLQDDIFNQPTKIKSRELEHDLKCIFSLQGQFRVADSYRGAYNTWRLAGCLPIPTHPRLAHYNSRRPAHMLKLSMVASVENRDDLVLEASHFEKALEWLTEAERLMPYTFQVSSSIDSRAMDEIIHLVGTKTVSETQLMRFVCERIPAGQAKRVVDLMVESRMLIIAGQDRLGLKFFKAP